MRNSTQTPIPKLRCFAKSRKGLFSELAGYLQVSESYLSQMISGYRPVPHDLAVMIEGFSKGKVSRIDCRPHDGEKVWPELAEKTINNRHG